MILLMSCCSITSSFSFRRRMMNERKFFAHETLLQGLLNGGTCTSIGTIVGNQKVDASRDGISSCIAGLIGSQTYRDGFVAHTKII
jgi:hypothetical protein